MLYTNWIEPQTSFRKVQAQYGGALHEFSLDGINKQYDTIMKTKNKYISEIIFKIWKRALKKGALDAFRTTSLIRQPLRKTTDSYFTSI